MSNNTKIEKFPEPKFKEVTGKTTEKKHIFKYRNKLNGDLYFLYHLFEQKKTSSMKVIDGVRYKRMLRIGAPAGSGVWIREDILEKVDDENQSKV